MQIGSKSCHLRSDFKIVWYKISEKELNRVKKDQKRKILYKNYAFKR